jgi:hypothetical protein
MKTNDKSTPEIDWDPLAHHHAPAWMTLAVVLVAPYMIVGLLFMNGNSSSLEMLTPLGAIDYLARVFLWPLYMIGLIPS